MPTATEMKGKAALVTGAASGLGRGTALALGRAGADVLIADVNAQGLEETAGLLRALGVKAEVYAADLTAADELPARRSPGGRVFGRLDALCNVAGMHPLRHTPEMPGRLGEDPGDQPLGALLPDPGGDPPPAGGRRRGGERHSSAAFIGEAYAAAYCATKAGITHMTKSLAMEYMHKPIRFNAVAPGG